MNIVDLLHEHARDRGHDVALRDTRGAHITFQELDDQVSRVAALLRSGGLRSSDAGRMGDVVLILQPVSITLYWVLLAVLRARLTAMLVDPGAGRAGIDQACRMIRPRAMIGNLRGYLYCFLSPPLWRVRAYWAGALPAKLRRLRLGGRALFPDEPCPDETAALLTFTSGSTGVPKVAMRSHGFLLAQHGALDRTLALQSQATGHREVVATTFPVFVLSHLACGACTLLCADPSPEQLSGVTAIDAAPHWCEELVEACRAQNVRLDGVRRIVVGGGPVFPGLLEALRTCAPNARVTILYGSTEAEPIAHVEHGQVTAEDLRDMRSGRGLLVGSPVGGINLRVLRDDFPATSATSAEFDAAIAPSGSAGEIVVSGPHVLPGYYRGMRDEETKFRVDGVVWHRTGDAGFLDERGRVWLLGRVGARVRDEHGDLYPFQVEAAAGAEPGVRRSALMARGGKRLLWVELRSVADPATPEKLRERLAWARLDRIVVCERIPTDRRHHSKVDYGALEKIAADALKAP